MKQTIPILVSIIASFICQQAYAQFALPGDNPASVKWYTTETPYYRIIYPEGLDSLARVYGNSLEKYRVPVGRTAGYAPGQMTRTRLPVIIHAFNSRSNGLVSWAPKRMELYSTPASPESEALPWITQLTIHESRHVAQMQGGLDGLFRPFKYIAGEMFNGLVAGLYPKIEMLEGDAVIAETALTKSGRGRTADFMNYYMIAFDHGDFRNWEKWRFGSQNNYYLNHYAAGYLMVGGIRYVYGYRDIVGDFYHHIAKRPYDLAAFENIIRKNTGRKIKDVYYDIAGTLHEEWQKDIEARKPFISSEAVTGTPSRYTEYASSDFIGGEIYSVKSGMTYSPELVRTGTGGKEKRLGAFGSGTSQLRHCPQQNCIYWSEPVSDERWAQKVNSLIRYKRLPSGRKRNLTRDGRMYNPFPHGGRLSVTEYTDDGRSHLVIMDAKNGKRIISKAAPDSVQFMESVWTDEGKIYVTGISGNGYGLYSTQCHGTGPSGMTEWENVIPPQPVKITSLDIAGDMISFTSDRTGVNEFYHFDPSSGELYQITSTRYGAQDFAYDDTGDTLYFSASEYGGKLIRKVPADSLMKKKVEFGDIHRYAMAEELSRQEAELAAADTVRGPHNGWETEFSEPRRYRKGTHLFNIHSWAPFYFDVDNIMAFSADHIYDMIALGAAAVSQNHLGTAVGRFGYSAHKDPYDRKAWRHSGHIKFTYSGWYPVIEASLDINDRGARTYIPRVTSAPEATYLSIISRSDGRPYIGGKITTYIPFNFSSGGWTRGLVPRVAYNIGNDIFRDGVIYSVTDSKGNETSRTVKYEGGTIRHSISGSVRFYTMRPVPNSAVYPRLGLGLETGVFQDLGMIDYMAPMGYAYIYGYVPGVIRQHGIRLSALMQHSLDNRKPFCGNAVNTLPRGLSENSALLNGLGNLSESMKLTADYAIPIRSGDLSILGTFMYIKRFVLTPHFDYTFFRGGDLYSAGATFAIDFRSIIWLEFPVTLGVTYSYNGGRSFNAIKQSGIPIGRHFVGPVFDISF